MKNEKLILLSRELIDSATEIHYAYHKSLSDITIEHSHDFYEIFLITKGKAIHGINGKEEIIEEGALVFIRPEDTHYYRKFNGENCELINLAFPALTLTELFNYFGKGYEPDRLLLTELPPEVKLSTIEKDILTTRLEGLNLLSRGNKKQIRTEFRILLAEIFSKYFTLIKVVETKDAPLWLETIKKEMERKENFVIGITRMQELSGKSAEHLSRVFKKYYNLTPTEFILNLRLNYAANLLGNSDENISGVSMEAGFDNLSHFYHLFKKHFQSSPKQFRTKHQKMIIPY
jgi:AraC family transcriptional regulator, dual regulator of chb operon